MTGSRPSHDLRDGGLILRRGRGLGAAAFQQRRRLLRGERLMFPQHDLGRARSACGLIEHSGPADEAGRVPVGRDEAQHFTFKVAYWHSWEAMR